MQMPDAVADQYIRYPYPGAADDIPTWLRSYNYEFHDSRLYAALFWPEGRPKPNLDILVAGCGTMQAAVIAFTNPESSVTGIDFSQTSIAHEERLRERHSLANLTLHQMDLLEVKNLGKTYDFVLCTGVLHHMGDPGQGLRALASVLEPSAGAMVLMLYGRAGRIGIYLLQDAFRRMDISQTPEGVRAVRNIISHLPPHHPGRRYYEHAAEMSFDAAVVDTFLHRRDQAFSVDDLLQLVEGNNLKFQSWLDSFAYNRNLEGLDPNIQDRERWSIVENLSASIPTHHFIVCRPERYEKTYISFQGDQWLAYFPQRHPTSRPSVFAKEKFCRASVGGTREFSLSPEETVLFAEASGKRTISKIIEHRAFAGKAIQERRLLAQRFYEQMWRLGHLYFSKVPLKNAKPALAT